MPFTPVNSGNQIIVTAGSPVTLSPASIPANRVDVQAYIGNVGTIYLGGPSVTAAGLKGIALEPGDVYSIEKMGDLLNIWIDTTNSGDGVSYNWWIGEIV